VGVPLLTPTQFAKFLLVGADTQVAVPPANVQPKTIKKNAGVDDLIYGDIKSGGIYEVEYDGTNLQLLSGIDTSGNKFVLVAGETISAAAAPIPVSVASNGFRKTVVCSTSNSIDWLKETSQPIGDVAANTRVGQGFKYTDADAATITVDSIQLLLYKGGTGGSDLIVEIQTDDGAGKPSNTAITNGSVTIAAASINASQNFQLVTFATPPVLTSGTQYHIVLRKSGGLDAGNHYLTRRYSSDVYSDGERTLYDGANWATQAGSDMPFYIMLDVDYSGKVWKLDADAAIKKRFIGFGLNDATAGNSLAIQGQGVIGGLSGLNIGQKYYADVTAGALTNDPTTGNNIIPVGKAISATSLLIEKEKQILNGITARNIGGDNGFGGLSGRVFYMFVDVGFKPDKVMIEAWIQKAAANRHGGLAVFVKTTGYPVLNMNDLDSSLKTINAQSKFNENPTSLIDADAIGLVQVSEIFENGFIIKFTMPGNNSPITAVSYMAEGS